jgi:predicted DNA-binding transcriptional regulator AlpA
MAKHNIDRRIHQVVADPIGSDPDRLMNTVECADWLGVSPTWLNIGRCKGYGPKPIKLTSHLVRYKVSDVLKWLEERRHAAA